MMHSHASCLCIMRIECRPPPMTSRRSNIESGETKVVSRCWPSQGRRVIADVSDRSRGRRTRWSFRGRPRNAAMPIRRVLFCSLVSSLVSSLLSGSLCRACENRGTVTKRPWGGIAETSRRRTGCIRSEISVGSGQARADHRTVGVVLDTQTHETFISENVARLYAIPRRQESKIASRRQSRVHIHTRIR